MVQANHKGLISAPALITRRIPLIIVPPMVTIPLGVTNEDYRSHFSSAFGASIGVHNTLMEKALETFHSAGTCLSVFRTDPCLFPRYKTYDIDDYSSATENCYPCQEGDDNDASVVDDDNDEGIRLLLIAMMIIMMVMMVMKAYNSE
jgi:hypothetical protein